jgi:hypothetical protein
MECIDDMLVGGKACRAYVSYRRTTKTSTKRHPIPDRVLCWIFGPAFTKEYSAPRTFSGNNKACLALLPDHILIRWKFLIETDTIRFLDDFRFNPNRANQTCGDVLLRTTRKTSVAMFRSQNDGEGGVLELVCSYRFRLYLYQECSAPIFNGPGHRHSRCLATSKMDLKLIRPELRIVDPSILHFSHFVLYTTVAP